MCLRRINGPDCDHICYIIRVGFVQGVWMVGVIDELQMNVTGNDRKLTLLDTKTRAQPRLPAEPQSRNGRYIIRYDITLRKY